MENIAILISGRDSNMQAIVNAGASDVRIAAILSNSATAAGLAWVAEYDIPTDSLDHKDFASCGVFDQTMMEKIDVYQPDLVVLIDFMRILALEFCIHYEGRLMNVRPPILPSFTGLHTHGHALAAGCRVAGCTVHFIAPELDCGSIISQGITPVFNNDTTDGTAIRVLKVEHRFFPQIVADLAAGRLKIEGSRVINNRSQPEDRLLLA